MPLVNPLLCLQCQRRAALERGRCAVCDPCIGAGEKPARERAATRDARAWELALTEGERIALWVRERG